MTGISDTLNSLGAYLGGALARIADPAAPVEPGTRVGVADEALARRNAQRVLAQLDTSRPNIVLWVPGTYNHGLPADWLAAVRGRWAEGEASVAGVEYPATLVGLAGAHTIYDSVATGVATTRIVVEEVARRNPSARITLGGHSQGAWVAGEVMADPATAALIDRAVLYGHPAEAPHQYRDGHDPKVLEVDNPFDPVTHPVRGVQDALEAATRLASGTGGLEAAVRAVTSVLMLNPVLAGWALVSHMVPRLADHLYDPHNYASQYRSGVAFLAGANSVNA